MQKKNTKKTYFVMLYLGGLNQACLLGKLRIGK